MFFLGSHSVAATATGQELKDVTCDKCGGGYHYLLARTAIGRSSASSVFVRESARRRAQYQAQARLKKRLRGDAELVPCPHCHWINRDLIARFRRSQYRPLSRAALGVLGAGAFTELLLCLSGIANQADDVPWQIFVMLVTVFSVFALLLAQFLLRRGIDPNRNAGGHPILPVGTPPALLKTIDAVTHVKGLAPVPSDFSNLQVDARWATYRPGQLALDQVCCQCLEPATTHFRIPVPTGGHTVEAPMCEACLRKLQWRWWLQSLAAVPLGIAAGWWLSRFASGIDLSSRMLLILFVTVFLTLVAVAINDRTLRPYRLRTADRSRNIEQIRFRNPACTALLIRKLGQQDGLYEAATNSADQTISAK